MTWTELAPHVYQARGRACRLQLSLVRPEDPYRWRIELDFGLRTPVVCAAGEYAGTLARSRLGTRRPRIHGHGRAARGSDLPRRAAGRRSALVVPENQQPGGGHVMDSPIRQIVRLQREIERLRDYIRNSTELANVCLFDVLNERCNNCHCGREFDDKPNPAEAGNP